MFDLPDLVATDDTFGTTVGVLLQVSAAEGVLANDTGSDGTGARIVSGPSHGQVDLADDGSFVYTPQPSFVGLDSFRYRVSVPGRHAEATATISVIRDFTISVDPASLDLVQGSSGEIAVSLTGLDTLEPPLAVTLTLTGLPDGVTASPEQISASAGDIVSFRLDTSPATPQSVWTEAAIDGTASASHAAALSVRVRGTSGTLDTTLGSSGIISLELPSYALCHAVATDPAGRITFAGRTFTGSEYQPIIGRLLDDGSWDTSFAGDSGGPGLLTFTGNDTGAFLGLHLEPDGSAIAAGYVHPSFNSGAHAAIAKITSNGYFDPSFGPFAVDLGSLFGESGQASHAWALLATSSQRRILAGSNEPGWIVLGARLPSGSVDTNFGSDGYFRFQWGASVSSLHFGIDGSGRVAVLGYSDGVRLLSRVTADGALDATFGEGDGRVTLPSHPISLAVKKEGEMLVSLESLGDSTDIRILEYGSSGNLVATFGSSGLLVIDGAPHEWGKVSLDSDGRMLVIGSKGPTSATAGRNLFVGRYLSDGTPDATFNGEQAYRSFSIGEDDSTLVPTASTVDAEGRIVICAWHSEPFASPEAKLLRIWP